MEVAGFVRCRRTIAARIFHVFMGYEVFEDLILSKNGTSQLSLLAEDTFELGMTHIADALQQAVSRGERIVFPADITLPAVIGFVP
jgi:hypothetical protein